jgi:hypothetical protein
MGIERRNKMCDIEGKYIEFNVTALSDWVHLGQVSLLI